MELSLGPGVPGLSCYPLQIYIYRFAQANLIFWCCFFFFFLNVLCYIGCLVAQTVKRLPVMWEIWVRSLGWEDPLEKEMATQCSTLCLENTMDGGAW